MSGLVLSLFPGIGLLDMAFEEEGFCVVRGPDLLWGGDIRRFHPPAGKFDGVIGGPPCQAFSSFRHLVASQGKTTAPDLIPEFIRCVEEASPSWFLMENVPDAPVPDPAGYFVRSQTICHHWLGGGTSRKRTFSFGAVWQPFWHVETLALHRYDPAPAILATGGHRMRPVAIGGSGKRKQMKASGRIKSAAYLAKAMAFQGAPHDFFDHSPLTVEGKIKVIGNGVPREMAIAVARAVKRALDPSIPRVA